MFSRAILKIEIALCMITMSGLLGCNLPINDTPPAPSDINAKLDASQCLESTMPTVATFVKGDATPNEVIGFWDCLGGVVSSFEKSTRGRYEDRFTALELTNFAERYYMPVGQKISPALRLEIFKIKQLLVGGTDDSITRVEMKNIIGVLNDIKMICLHLNPYMKVYSMNWNLSPVQGLDSDIKYFENANLEIQQAAKDFADIVTKNGQSYHLDNVVLLLKELEKFGTQSWGWLDDVEKAMPLVQKLKKTLAGGSGSDILPTEWRRFFLLSFRGYIQFLRYHYFINTPTSHSTTQQLIYVTRSVDDLFSYLGDMVDGKQEKTLTRAELLEIMQGLAQFVPRLNVSDALLVEVMKIKVIFFGGRIDYFEKADFDRARDKLENFRKLAEQFITYAKVYTFNWKTESMTAEEQLQYFKQAEFSLVQFGEKVGENLEGRYDLKDLVSLAKEIDQFLGDDKSPEQALESKVAKLIPVVVAVKNIIFNDADSMVGSSIKAASHVAWKDFLGLTAQGFSRLLYFNYFVKGESITTGLGITHAENLVNDSTAFLEKILARKTESNQQITFKELNRLWAVLAKAEMLPGKISAGSLDKVTNALFSKMLMSPESRLSGKKVSGLSKEALDILRGEFAIWAGVQRFNDWLYQGVPEDLGRPGYQILSAIGAGTSDGLKELKLIYQSPMEVSFDAFGRMPLQKPGVYYRRSTADYINMIRAGVRLALRGYAGDLSRIKNYSGIKETEMKLLFADVKDLVIEMGMLSPSNTTFAEARFRDGNLFTSNSNGDDYLSFNEATHLVMMITSGLKLNSMFYAEVEKNCRINDSAVSKDDWTVDFKCITPIYQARMKEVFSSMPDLVHFMKYMSTEQFQNFYLNMMKAGGYDPTKGTAIKLGDLGQFPHVTQYVEMIFQMYDANRDGFLNTEEAMKAFPTYRNILFQAAGGKVKKEKDLKGLFAWLLKYGKPPGGLWKSLKFLLIWVPKGEKGWDVSADREKLATILGFIAQETAKLERSTETVKQ